MQVYLSNSVEHHLFMHSFENELTWYFVWPNLFSQICMKQKNPHFIGSFSIFRNIYVSSQDHLVIYSVLRILFCQDMPFWAVFSICLIHQGYDLSFLITNYHCEDMQKQKLIDFIVQFMEVNYLVWWCN